MMENKIKIAAFSMIKNECDVIELFIKINSRIFDKIFIADHGSTDATPLIIEKLIQDKFPVEYYRIDDVAYEQSKITTNFVRNIAGLNVYDFICPVDADEFYCDTYPGELRMLLNERMEYDLLMLPWKTFCPTNDDYYNNHAPIHNHFRPRSIEPIQYFKIIIRNEFAKHCNIAMGNHLATNIAMDCKTTTLPYPVNHIPIRSSDQLVQKVIIGSQSFKLKSHRVEGEGFHWDDLARLVREKNYFLDYKTLVYYAKNYATPITLMSDSIDLILDHPGLGLATDFIEYKDESLIRLTRTLDKFTDQLINYIKTLQKI